MEGQYDRAEEGADGADAADRAAILNNVGFAAMLRGDYTEAENLFDQAIKLRGKYYALAATNLQMIQNLKSGSNIKSADTHDGAH